MPAVLYYKDFKQKKLAELSQQQQVVDETMNKLVSDDGSTKIKTAKRDRLTFR